MSLPLTRRIRNRAREAGLYLWNGLRPTPPGQVRVVIFGQGRAGKSLLEGLICSTGHFEGHEELLNVDRHGEIIYPLQFVQGSAKWSADTNFIFQVKVYQLTRDRRRPLDPAAFLRALCERGWRIVYLKRENVLKQALSNFIVENRTALRKVDGVVDGVRDARVFVDCERLVERVRERERFQEQERAALANVEHYSVLYERDLEEVARRQQTIDGLLDHLGLESRVATTSHRGGSAATLAQLIANYEEFVFCVTANGWQHFLD